MTINFTVGLIASPKGAKTPCARLIMLLKSTCFRYYGRRFTRCTRMFHLVGKIIPYLPLSPVPLCQFIYHERKYSYAVYFHRENQITRLHKIINISFRFETIIFAYTSVYIRERLVYMINRDGSEIYSRYYYYFSFFQNELHFLEWKMEFLKFTLYILQIYNPIYHFSLLYRNFYFSRNTFRLFAR